MRIENQMPRHNERGIALVLALFLVSALSVLGASLMFLAQTETNASMNYRMMSQVRYAAESGVQKASNFVLDPAFLTPADTAALLGVNCNRNVSPVTCLQAGVQNPVVLSATAAMPSNYPIAAVQTAFNAAGQGTMAAGNSTLTYNSYATLMGLQQFDAYGGGTSVTATWQLTGTGGLVGYSKAVVEILALGETPKVSASSYAAFSTANTCAAMAFHGNVTIDSYDSSIGPPTGAGNSTTATGGDVGTNGNLDIQGSVSVEGNLYSPRTGVGTCTQGNVSALSEIGSAQVTGSIIKLPAEVQFPAPVFSTIPPTSTVTVNAALLAGTPAAACSALGLTLVTNCLVNAATKTITVDGHGLDVTLPSVSIASGYIVVFVGHAGPAANVNVNSLSGSGEIQIQANMGATNLNESVVLKVAGKNPDGTDMAAPFDLSTMSWKQNATVNAANKFDASAVQIVYGGPGTISMKGNDQSAVTIYAPNAAFTLQGTPDIYGSILAKTILSAGNADIHYDRRLKRDFYVVGHPIMGTFNWKRF